MRNSICSSLAVLFSSTQGFILSRHAAVSSLLLAMRDSLLRTVQELIRFGKMTQSRISTSRKQRTNQFVLSPRKLINSLTQWRRTKTPTAQYSSPRQHAQGLEIQLSTPGSIAGIPCQTAPSARFPPRRKPKRARSSVELARSRRSPQP